MSTFGRLIPNKIQLLRVDIVKGLIENPPGLEQEDIVGYEFGMGYSNGFNPEEKLAKTELEIRITSQDHEEGPQAKGLFLLAFLFKVDNLEELVKHKEEGIVVSPHLGNAMASISYSTARGILLTRFQGTILKDFILPVIDPNELLKPENSLQDQQEEGSK